MMAVEPISAARMKAIVNAAKARREALDKAPTEEQRARSAMWGAAFDDPEGPAGDQPLWQYAGWVAGGMEGLHAEPVTFIAEEKFAGSRPGRAFKLGTEGLGYYQEGRREKVEISILKLIRPMVDLNPATLQLDETLDFATIIGDPCEATHADEEPDADDRPSMWEAAVRTKCQKAAARKKARRTRNAVTKQAGLLRLKSIDGDAFDELSTEYMVGLKDRSHRDLGWWAFDSVNANAWPWAAEHLASTAADFTAVQEAKVEAQEVNDIEASSRGLGWRNSVGVCLHTDGGGRSAGVAVACRSHVGMADACDDDVLPETLLGRFLVKKLGAVCKGGVP